MDDRTKKLQRPTGTSKCMQKPKRGLVKSTVEANRYNLHRRKSFMLLPYYINRVRNDKSHTDATLDTNRRDDRAKKCESADRRKRVIAEVDKTSEDDRNRTKRMKTPLKSSDLQVKTKRKKVYGLAKYRKVVQDLKNYEPILSTISE